MINPEIIELTLEQESQILSYREKWRKKAFSTEVINKEKATLAINKAYQFVGYDAPHQIIFFPSPRAANEWIIQQSQHLKQSLLTQKNTQTVYASDDFLKFFQKGQIISTLIDIKVGNHQELQDFLTPYQKYKLNVEIEQDFKNQSRTYRTLLAPLKKEVYNKLNDLEDKQREEIFKCIAVCLKPEQLAIDACKLDFAISVLNYSHKERQWEILKNIIDNCGWIYPFEKICLVCERPTNANFDPENRPHALGEPALKFADGLGVYAAGGVILPEKYGKYPPQQWQPQWLLDEPNSEIRRVLIQGIGYGRLCLELKAIKLDSWREYTLLVVDHNLDVEPIYLLKMTCPSTGHMHVLRVPPEMTSAREAIAWSNWGIDPEEFSIST